LQHIVLFIFISVTSLFASFNEYDYHTKDIEILKSFDIDESFLSDKGFIKVQNSLETHRKDIFIKRLDNAYMLIPMLKQKIKEADIPESFLYLAMAESNFLLKAYSRKRASGLWQFMPRTGKRYGLDINLYVDERRDMMKSTDAAITYLKRLHTYYDKWYLAILSYNCGEGRVAEAILRSSIDKYINENPTRKNSYEVKYLKNYLKKVRKGRVYISSVLDKTEKMLGVDVELSDLMRVQKKVRRQYLPRESRHYIRKIVAYATMANRVNYMTEEESDHLLNHASVTPITSVTIKGGVHLSYIADAAQMNLDELSYLNGHLNYALTPTYSKEYQVYLPYEKLATFKENYDPSTIQNRYVIHKVSKGDNLGYIGRKYGINYKIIKSYNNLRSDMLSLNQKLIIPILNDNEVAVYKTKSYIVKSGDTVSSISRKYQTTVNQIVKDNNLESDGSIKIGDTLVIN
jgi:membrane-bound lytic murein transglycosylase D